MHFSKLLPLAAFASLAAAQIDDYLAKFFTEDHELFGIPLESTGSCVNFEESGPKYTELFVEVGSECFLYENKDCDDIIGGFDKPQFYNIGEFDFSSVVCYGDNRPI